MCHGKSPEKLPVEEVNCSVKYTFFPVAFFTVVSAVIEPAYR